MISFGSKVRFPGKIILKTCVGLWLPRKQRQRCKMANLDRSVGLLALLKSYGIASHSHHQSYALWDGSEFVPPI